MAGARELKFGPVLGVLLSKTAAEVGIGRELVLV